MGKSISKIVLEQHMYMEKKPINSYFTVCIKIDLM